MKSKKIATKKADISRVTRSVTKNKLEKGDSHAKEVLKKIKHSEGCSDMNLTKNIKKIGKNVNKTTARNTHTSVIENVPANIKILKTNEIRGDTRMHTRSRSNSEKENVSDNIEIIEINESRMRTRSRSKSEKEDCTDNSRCFEENIRKASTRIIAESNDANSSGKMIDTNTVQQFENHNKIIEFIYEENENVFISSDFVWAKLRGHPIWPAKVSVLCSIVDRNHSSVGRFIYI